MIKFSTLTSFYTKRLLISCKRHWYNQKKYLEIDI